MRSILSGGKVCLFLLIFTFSACGGGGGGGGGVSTLADLQAAIEIPNPGETATVLIEVLSDGTVDWAGAVPVDVVGVVTGLTINRVADASVLADLLGAGTFDATTGTASGSVAISPADAADLAANPGDYLVTLLTSTKPPASGGLATFTGAEWHTVLLGTNESPVADAGARGAATFKVVSPTTIDFVIAMTSPTEAAVTLAHIHAGAAGTNGGVVVDLDVPSAVHDAAAGTISGTIAVGGETVARIASDLQGFYCNVHTATAPNGVARGQLKEGTVEMTAALLGSAEVPTVVDTFARGGATFEFTSLTGGHAILAFDSSTETIDDVTLAHIHVGAAGTPGTALVNLMGADYATSPTSDSAESAITYTQKDFTRILANPAGFYANLHTPLGPNGTVRGQLSTGVRTVFAPLSGAQETTPAVGSGTLRVIFTGVHACEYTITMTTPAASAITAAHVHDGALGVDGPALVDLFGGGDATVSGNTITGTASVPGRTVARLLAGTPGGSALAGGSLPSTFYGNVHSAANPGGTARGQFTQISGTTPPAGLAYTSPVVYLTGQPITPNAPTSNGGAITNYSATPPLPAGLTINATTGIISGTPTATTAGPQDFTVTASNAGGSTIATVNITVNVGPPLSLSYTTPVGYIVGTPITPNVPAKTGGAISNYGISPSLPGGLSLNTTTGVISGTPTATSAAQNYTVTGSNAAGTIQATVNISVTSTATAPSNLAYSTPVNYPTGYAITSNTPTVSGTTPMTFSVSPALPTGLTLNGTSGVISGTPTVVTSAANYTVTATNSVGSTQATVNITVSLGKPGPFTYSNDPNLGYTGFAIQSMTPTHTGGGPVTSYSVSPSLPNGLSLNTTTGVVSGTPTSTTVGAANFTVTATNSAGSTQTTITISIPY